MEKWTFEDIPDQSGRIAIVTGANTGIGYETAVALAKKGADVTLACRSQKKGQEALDRIRGERLTGTVRPGELDLSDLVSVKSFAARFSSEQSQLHLLINNAGVMVPPESKTKQGFELQFGVNHLGHFALTGQLLQLLRATPGARIVNVSSTAHHFGRIDFDDLHFFKRGYKPWQAYGQSKLANLLFTLEHQRRIKQEGLDITVAAAHPGWTGTDLQRNAGFARFMNRFFAMQPARGALPTLRAATDPAVQGGEYYGPHGMREMRGYPVKAKIAAEALRTDVATRLWEVSEEMTGVIFAGG